MKNASKSFRLRNIVPDSTASTAQEERGFSLDNKYLIAAVICLLMVVIRYFVANFCDNEWVYSIGPIKIIDKSFLSSDPFMHQYNPFFLVYDSITSPFYYIFDYLTATLIVRVLIWIFQIWALTKLSKTVGISWWGVILLFALWLNVEQTLAAGEWIIGSASAKPVAYGFFFLAMNSLLRRRFLESGAYSGVAISFHVVVGIWAAAAIFCAILITQSKTGERKKLLAFCAVASMMALPGLMPAWREAMAGTAQLAPSIAASEIARLSVVWANPFHLDPYYFLSPPEYVKVALFFCCSIIMLYFFLPREKAFPMIIVLGILCLFFMGGLIARRIEWYEVLKYYPFRVADAMIPLSFWMGFVLMFQKMFSRIGKKGMLLVLSVPFIIGSTTYVNDRFEPKHSYNLTLRGFEQAMLKTEPRLTAYWIRERSKEWRDFILGRKMTDLEAAEEWIKEHTPKDSVFITPPWEFSFALKAQRAEFVSFKWIPVNYHILEWKRRMELLNRGNFNSVGWGILRELMKHYPQLTREELRSIKGEYRADYFLTSSKKRLHLETIYENNTFRLYKL
jgi:hypothetical protein